MEKKYFDEFPLNDKKILFIGLSGYSNGIIQKLKDLGASVDYINDKPNDGVICKTCGRLQIKSYQKILIDYYKKKIASLHNEIYDYIFVLRGEYTPIPILKTLKLRYKDALMILYMWDGLKNYPKIVNKFEYFDRVYSFDRIDAIDSGGKIIFLPLFYFDDCVRDNADSGSCDYDISFIGTAHEDRIPLITNIFSQCRKVGLKCYSYFYLPKKVLFYYNKLFNRNYRRVKSREIHFQPKSFDELYSIYSKSKCVVDIENSGQNGLTMRTIETLGLKKKLITTNADIVNYDFYNPNNILVIDRENPKIDSSFFDVEYQALDCEIYNKYSLTNWLLTIFRL